MHYELKGIIFKDKAVITSLKEYNFNSNPIWKTTEPLPSVAKHGTCIEATLFANYGLWKNPKNSPNCWQFSTDQRQTPSWFQKEHKKLFRIAADNWWREHVLVHTEITHLSNGFYYLKNCHVKKVCGDACIICEDSRIDSVEDSACILSACGNSVIDYMRNNSRLNRLQNNSMVLSMYDSAYIEQMTSYSMLYHLSQNAQVKCMSEHSRIRQASGDSRISVMKDESLIHVLAENAVVEKMQGLSFVTELTDHAKIKEICSGHAVIPVPKMGAYLPFN